MKSLTGIRGIFAIYVFFYHLFPVRSCFVENGYLSVDVFLVLSGFILSFIYGDERDGFTGGIDVNKVYIYLKRRIFRIYPIHIFSIVMVILYVSLSHTFMHLPIYQLFYNIFLVQILLKNGSIEIGHRIIGDINMVSWSLSAEAILYIFLPYALFLIGILNKFKLPIFVVLMMAFQFIYINYDHPIHHPIKGYISFFRCFCDFMIGVVVCRDDFFSIKSKNIHIIIDLLFALLVFLVCFKKTGPLVVVVSVIVIKNIHNSRSFIERFLAMKPIFYIGEISFSIYMIHLIVGMIMSDVFSNVLFRNFKGHEFVNYLLFTLIISMCTYHFIEKPSRRYLRRRFD